jgi:hypothetical protein
MAVLVPFIEFASLESICLESAIGCSAQQDRFGQQVPTRRSMAEAVLLLCCTHLGFDAPPSFALGVGSAAQI